MNAIRIETTGGPEVLRYVSLPTPEPKAHEVRVRAEAIGVGKPDVLIRTGIYPWMPPLPAIPGNEMVGIVDAVGSDARGVAVGTRVFVSARELPFRGGCYAEHICVPAESVFVLPAHVDPLGAAGLGNYQLANAMLFDAGNATPRSILVHGAAGGVGTALVQTARANGIRAIGVVSTDAKRDFALAAGADVVVQRNREDVHAAVMRATDGRGVDVVFDHMGGPGFVANLDLLGARGTLVSYNVGTGIPPDNMIEALRRRLDRSLAIRCYSIHTLDSDRERRRELMQRAIQAIADGRVRPPRPAVFALRDAVQAHRLLDSGEVIGKVALVP